jgi:hypothetical protein
MSLLQGLLSQIEKLTALLLLQYLLICHAAEPASETGLVSMELL